MSAASGLRCLLKEQKLPAAVESRPRSRNWGGDKEDRLCKAASGYRLWAGAANQAHVPSAEKLADQALALLKQTVAKGAAHMKQDKDLDALRDLADFQKLFAELEVVMKG
jgi:hypothetical protein